MPKYQWVCNNPFHEKWSKRDKEKVINLRARGLSIIANIFEQYVETELGKKPSRKIKNLCSTCLHQSFKKRKFTKLLPTDSADTLKNKVERLVRKIVDKL